MKVRKKKFGTIGVVADSDRHTKTHILVVWESGSLFWKQMESVKNLIFIVPAPMRRINNA